MATAGAVVALGLLLAGCSTTEDVVDDGLETLGSPVEVTLAGATVTMRVPEALGPPSGPVARTGDCPADIFSWQQIPVGSDDPGPLLFLGTTTQACPEAQAQNGSFPTWAADSDVPTGAVPVDTGVGPGQRFELDYTQCTNECYSRTYSVAFIPVGGELGSMWVQWSGIPAATAQQMVDSLRLRG